MDHYSFQAQLTRISPAGLTPDGLRIDLGFAGTVTAGSWAGCAAFAADIDWHVPGSSPVAGHYRGRDAVAGFFGQLAGRSGGSFRLDVHEVTAAGDRVVALVTEHAEANGARLAARAVHVWRVGDGGVAEFTDYYHDQASVDAFWSQPASVAG